MKKQNKILKIIAVVVAIVATTTQSFGQQADASKASNDNKEERSYCPGEISIWGAGGLSTLSYNPEYGKRSNMLGGAFGIGYSYYWSKHFGLLLGAELALYQSKFSMNGFQDNYNTVDLDVYRNPENINFRYRLDNYEESQRLWNVNIPLMLQYQTPLGANTNHRFFAAAGFKLGVPVKADYKISGYKITSAGYYYDDNSSHQVLHNVTELGFGEFSSKPVKSKADFDLSYTGTLETGIKWHLGSRMELYTGLYLDYAFNDVVKSKHDKHPVEYNSFNGNNFEVTNSILASQYAPTANLYADALSESPARSMTTRVSPVAFGLKLRLGIGTCKSKSAEKEENADKKLSGKKDKKDNVSASSDPAGKIKRKPIIAKPEDEEEIGSPEVIMPEDKALEEEIKRASLEYGSSLRGMINIEMEGYELDQSELTPHMKEILDDKIAQIRKTYGTNISIVCEGHTCNTGSESYNMKLGRKRAEEVRKLLINRGFDPNKVVVVSKGQYLPIVPNTSEANRKKNRRVMLIIKD